MVVHFTEESQPGVSGWVLQRMERHQSKRRKVGRMVAFRVWTIAKDAEGLLGSNGQVPILLDGALDMRIPKIIAG